MKLDKNYEVPKIIDEIETSVKLPRMVSIPEGIFLMGTSERHILELVTREDWAKEWKDQGLFKVEQPYHKVYLPPYEIAAHPVTNYEYQLFVFETGYRVPRWWFGFNYPADQGNDPVVGISWIDAQAYISWLNQMTGDIYRLPSEAEWEKAARGVDGRIYPWGNNFDPWRCNTAESAKGATTPVGSYSPSGDSPMGVSDMIGNVWEMTNTIFRTYPYNPMDGREEHRSGEKRVVRGGAWYYTKKLARCAAREAIMDDYISMSLGFRLARTVDPNKIDEKQENG